MPKVFAFVLAAGQGTRIGDPVPKQYIPLAGKPMMFHSIEAVAAVSRVNAVLVVLAPLDRHWGAHDWTAMPEKVEAAFVGGAHRGESVLNALKHIESRAAKDDWVLVHDAARPCILTELVDQFLDEIGDDPVGGLLAMPLADTLKRAEEDTLRVEETVSRAGLWRAQTPQLFRYGILRKGLERKITATDEAEAVESLGQAPRLAQGENSNIKVTYAEDLAIAEMILQRQGRVRP
jgi:2-C-methyl-D-erythritol 4-phosphate cytidylyltransferase